MISVEKIGQGKQEIPSIKEILDKKEIPTKPKEAAENPK
jgi:hypothetical protein